MAPGPLRVRAVCPSPSAMTPLKVIELPLLGAMVSVAAAAPLLITAPPATPLSDSEGTVWL